MAWNQIASLKGPPGDPGTGGGSSAWADITGKPNLVSPDDWFFLITPRQWDVIQTTGSIGAFATGSGSVSIPNPGAAGLRQSLPRWSATSGAAANTALEQSPATTPIWRGGMAGLGGFVYRQRFAVTSAVANQRAYFGLRINPGLWGGGADVYGLQNGLALAFDASVDSNWHIAHSGYGAATKINLGANFPINNPAAVLDVEFKCAPNASTVSWSVKDINSGATASGEIATNLPGNIEFLYPRVYMNNGGTAAAVSCDVMMLYGSSYRG